MYFCTSKTRIVQITASGFSWPSAILVCKAEYISLTLMLIGEAPSALNMEVQSGLTGTRILKPSRSAVVTMALVEEEIWRKPLSQMCSMAVMPDLAMAARI